MPLRPCRPSNAHQGVSFSPSGGVPNVFVRVALDWADRIGWSNWEPPGRGVQRVPNQIDPIGVPGKGGVAGARIGSKQPERSTFGTPPGGERERTLLSSGIHPMPQEMKFEKTAHNIRRHKTFSGKAKKLEKKRTQIEIHNDANRIACIYGIPNHLKNAIQHLSDRVGTACNVCRTEWLPFGEK